MSAPCPVCDGREVEPFVSLPALPVLCNRLYASAEEAVEVERGGMELAFCPDCGHVANVAFDPRLVEYAPGYENSLAFSETFRAYAEQLVEDLVRRHSLQGALVVEIGCGRAELLSMLAKRTGGRGVGFDPSAPEERPAPGVRVIRAIFDREADVSADLVVCRHCLEHVATPVELLSGLGGALAHRPPTPIFFEVPNLLYTLRDGGIWDLIYEHCGYFSSASFARAFEEAGLTVEEVCPVFGGQFLALHAWSAEHRRRLPRSAAEEVSEIRRHVTTFGSRYQSKLSCWQDRLRELRQGGRRAAVWGAGSKGATFLNLVDPEAAAVDRVVDQNPRKQGGFVAGTGHPIVPPAALREAPPDLVIAMNPAYLGEIRAGLRAMGVEVELCIA